MKLSRPAVALFTFGALAGMTSVGGAAFATHALGKMVPDGERAVALFQQGTTFQMNHALALIIVTLVSERVATGLAQTVLRLSATLMALSILLFPGALYSSVFGGPQFFAPYGGNASMIGWLLFGVGALLTLRNENASSKGSVSSHAQPHAAE